MFNKKPIKSSVFANGSDENGLRYGGSGWKSSLDISKFGLERYKVRKGPNKIDIIPFNAGPNHPLVVAGQCDPGDTVYSLDYFVHKSIGPNKSDFTCLKQYGKRCPICEESQRYYNKGDDDSKKKGSELRSKRRVVYLVHDLLDGKYYTWDTGWNSFEKPISQKASVTNDPKTGAPVNPFDWENGRTISFVGVEDSYNNVKYNKISEVTINFEERGPLSDEVLSNSKDLSEIIVLATEDEMDAALCGKPVVSQQSVQGPAQTTSQLAAQAAEEPVQQTVPVQSAPVQEAPVQAAPVNVCPCGYAWGEADSHTECASCKVWDKCIDG